MQSSEPIRILTVDDHPLLREGIASLIGSQTDMEIVDEAAGGRQAIELYRRHRPDVTLMDLRMADMDGVEAMSEIIAEYPQARIIMLTTYDGDVQILKALKAGARGYLLKGSLRRELIDAIRAVHAGRKRMSPEAASQVANYAGDSALTLREIEVLELIAAGCANKIVADKLSITEDTVKAHVRSILSKLGANDRTHAVTIALKRGIINI
ncbi:MAG: response regulator transcription factor [Terracidiphilus sp.]|nr:response regulator transcription factor [Terracidiphilus sp.]